jgi:hypothetical protein
MTDAEAARECISRLKKLDLGVTITYGRNSDIVYCTLLRPGMVINKWGTSMEEAVLSATTYYLENVHASRTG